MQNEFRQTRPDGDRDTVPASSGYSMPQTLLITFFPDASSVHTTPLLLGCTLVKMRDDGQDACVCLSKTSCAVCRGGCRSDTDATKILNSSEKITHPWRSPCSFRTTPSTGRRSCAHTCPHAIVELADHQDLLGDIGDGNTGHMLWLPLFRRERVVVLLTGGGGASFLNRGLELTGHTVPPPVPHILHMTVVIVSQRLIVPKEPASNTDARNKRRSHNKSPELGK